ncbi:MAG: transcriptional repressor LexA [Verrucomicrobiia bacterium]
MPRRSLISPDTLLNLIRSCLATEGRPPTIRELQSRLGFRSPRAISYHLEKLEAEGRIVRRGKSRNIQLLDPAPPHGIPCFETIPAGLADPATHDRPSGYLPLEPTCFHLPPSTRLFAVRVRGDSMMGEGILDGDWAFFEHRPPRTGDIVAALIDGGTTLKRLVQEGGRVLLRAANPAYPDIVPETQLEIQGVLVGISRTIPSAAHARPPASATPH